MKKILLACASIIILNFQFSIFNSLHAQSFDWGRISLSADYATQGNAFGLTNGLRLKDHPERAVHLTAAYRLGRRWELGLYGGYHASTATTGSTTASGSGPVIRSVYIEDGSELIYGAFVQWYIIPYDKRQLINVDAAFRVGFDLSGTEADNFWAGMTSIYRVTDHVAICLDLDFGSFRYASVINFINDKDTWGMRSALRLQVSL
ncbi:MAG: hypothetical protein IJ634_06560 [Bacteroidales bacterium]|nr:hypothetical protein [Bacteroidales bacterium]